MRTQLIYLITLLFFGAGVKAQDFDTDFAAVADRIRSAVNCHLVSTVTVYDSRENKQKVTSFTTELRKSETAYRSRMGEVEVIANRDLMILVDHEEKVVQVEKAPDLSKADREFLQEFYALDSASGKAGQVSLIAEEGSYRTYRVNRKNGLIHSMTVKLNTATKSLVRLEYEYDKIQFPSGNYVVIEYTKYDLEAAIDKIIFKGEDVVTRKGGRFELNEKYRGFELLDLYE